MSPLRLERVTGANSGDLPGYAAERAAEGEGGPLLVEAVANPDAYLDHVRRFAEGIDLPADRVRVAAMGGSFWASLSSNVVVSASRTSCSRRRQTTSARSA